MATKSTEFEWRVKLVQSRAGALLEVEKLNEQNSIFRLGSNKGEPAPLVLEREKNSFKTEQSLLSEKLKFE